MDRFENFTVSILKLNKLIHKIKLYEMEEYDLRAIHVMCIYYLNSNPDITATELAKLTLEDKAAISRALKMLAEKGYVNYTADGYNAKITLTDAGKAVSADIAQKAAAAVDAAGGSLSEKQRGEFYESLGAILKDLEKYYEKLSKK